MWLSFDIIILEEISKLPEKDVEGQIDKICADIQARKERRVALTPELKEQMEFYHKTHASNVINKNMALDYNKGAEGCVYHFVWEKIGVSFLKQQNDLVVYCFY